MQKPRPNLSNSVLVNAIIQAAARAGSNGRGKGGLVGFLENAAARDPRGFGKLIDKVLETEIHTPQPPPKKETKPMTLEEAVEELKKRGLPVPSRFAT